MQYSAIIFAVFTYKSNEVKRSIRSVILEVKLALITFPSCVFKKLILQKITQIRFFVFIRTQPVTMAMSLVSHVTLSYSESFCKLALILKQHKQAGCAFYFMLITSTCRSQKFEQ
ncbi:Hypothetical_protein [Hexamita inflata]|uniref:Hypothetical_protein n=1 Tax=Hexamita inflata TaxID=28002 RepID=A0AA86PE33_9EUKA|nr:Hypothetical protein HINF_LOCUS24462 [Hexamita inflata]